MSQDHNDIYSIVERLRLIEADLSPASTRKGLTPQQKSVPQLPALFKPKTISVLKSKTDPAHPMKGYAVGSGESAESDSEKEVLESMATEDVLDKVKKSFTDFIKQAEETIKDSDIKEKKKTDTDLKKKDNKDRDLIVKAAPVTEDPTEQEPTTTIAPVVTPQEPVKNPTYAESAPVKTVTMEDGNLLEIHGNERDGFEIRRQGRCMPSRFENLDHAVMAVEMYLTRRRKADESQDYIDEA
jgi:hypothetical protein